MTVKQLERIRTRVARLRATEDKLINDTRKILGLKYPEGYHARVMVDYLRLGRGTPTEVLTLAKEGTRVV